LSFLLDTNICIAILKSKGDTALVNRLSEGSPKDFSLCSIVIAELHFGARKSQRVAENLAVVEKFVAAFPSADFGSAAAQQYGIIRAVLENQVTPIGENDLLIASIALAEGLTVVTRNAKDFKRVPELMVEVW
jgi:tRNA(fMet)-specific endonuclease VapC